MFVPLFRNGSGLRGLRWVQLLRTRRSSPSTRTSTDTGTDTSTTNQLVSDPCQASGARARMLASAEAWMCVLRELCFVCM